MWNDLKDKSIIFPGSSSVVLVTNCNLDEHDPNKYYVISVENLLRICDEPFCHWTHWMRIPQV